MKTEEGPLYRQLKGISKLYADVIFAFIPITGIIGVINLPSYFKISLYLQQYIGFIFGLVVASCFVITPAKRGHSIDKLPWYDLICSVISLITGLYIAVNYKAIAVDIGLMMPERVILGTFAVLLTLETSRRVVGLPFVGIILFFIIYALSASHFPGGLRTKSISFQNLATFLYLDPQGILGTALEVATTIVLIFIFFGQTISSVGISKLFNELAMALMGRFRGGPAKVAVVASSLFGMISGSPVANVATIGVFTIPLMKKAGYKPYFAGAVEAVSSTGGAIMPPIMGAAAFIMATFLGIPYSKVALAAAIPAIFYYVAVFIQVDLRAAKENLKGMPKEELPKFWNVLKKNWPFSIPFLVLVYTLFVMWMEAEIAGLISIIVTVLLGFMLKRRTGMNIKKLLWMFRDGGKGLLEVGVTCAGAGLIIGVLSITGLAFMFSAFLISMAKGNVFLLLLLSAIGASILGCGMPVTAVYLLMVVLTAPALVEMGISPLLAHFFVFYYGVLSFLTPPVCLAAYAAASIAGSNMAQTGFQAMKLGVAAYLVPFIFAYRPGLILEGNVLQIIQACIATGIAISLIAIGLEGFLFRPLHLWKRISLFAGALSLMYPSTITDVTGICIALPILFIEWRARRKTSLQAALEA
jgi:TRAP transporter 4TM/12TM fusion protein